MIALAVMFNSAMLALNICFIERGSVFDSNSTGVSWLNLGAALASAFTLGFLVRSGMD